MLRLPSIITRRSSQLLSKRSFSTTLARLNAQNSKKKSDTAVNFRNFVSVGIISSIILVQVVDAVNDSSQGRNNGRSLSEAEYARQQARLKRKKALFDEDALDVKFLWSDKDIKEEIKVPGYEVINPLQLIGDEKNNKDSKFYDLLNEPNFVIPRGLVNDLVKTKLAKDSEGENGNKKFIVVLDNTLDYDLKDFIQFEDKIKTLDNLIVLKSEKLHDAQRYYQTVKKVIKVDSIDELREKL